jgi:hypothetical protein
MVGRPSTLKTKTSLVNLGLLYALFMGIFGCSPTSSPNYASLGLVKVSGTLKLDGAPLSNVEVRFENPETSIYSYGTTNDSGRFSLMFDSRTAGVIPGRKLLRVLPKQKSEASATDSTGASEGEQDDPDRAAPAAEQSSAGPKVPECYSRKSAYFIQITGATSSLDLDLKSDCSSVSEGK